MSVHPECTIECEASPDCTVCLRRKPPIGRSVSPYQYGGYCEHECPGHNELPRAGHLWPGELRRERERQEETADE